MWFLFVECIGFEPTTPALSRRCSKPTELTLRFPADNASEWGCNIGNILRCPYPSEIKNDRFTLCLASSIGKPLLQVESPNKVNAWFTLYSHKIPELG